MWSGRIDPEEAISLICCLFAAYLLLLIHYLARDLPTFGSALSPPTLRQIADGQSNSPDQFTSNIRSDARKGECYTAAMCLQCCASDDRRVRGNHLCKDGTCGSYQVFCLYFEHCLPWSLSLYVFSTIGLDRRRPFGYHKHIRGYWLMRFESWSFFNICLLQCSRCSQLINIKFPNRRGMEAHVRINSLCCMRVWFCVFCVCG